MKYFVNRRHTRRTATSRKSALRRWPIDLKVAFNQIPRSYFSNTVKMKLALFALFAGSAAAFAPAQTGVRSLSAVFGFGLKVATDGLKSEVVDVDPSPAGIKQS